jgi:hypothetical protein
MTVTASTDLTAPGTGPATSSEAVSVQEMADQMADVAWALFALLLLQGAEKPVHTIAPDPPAAQPTEVPVAFETSAAPILMPSVPALAVALAEFDLDPPPGPAGMPMIAVPTPLPMPGPVPQLEAELTPDATETPHAVAMPAIVPVVAPTMAMLSEIEFLDE